jgi:hypothetical protein
LVRLANLYALSISAAAVPLASCGGSQGALSLPAAPPALAQCLPRGNGEVQYIANFGNGTLSEFDYPKSQSQIGQISGISDPVGECN